MQAVWARVVTIVTRPRGFWFFFYNLQRVFLPIKEILRIFPFRILEHTNILEFLFIYLNIYFNWL
jgi:hypothetical protein